MMDVGSIAEIIATYQKHGWILRRILLSPALDVRSKDELQSISGGVPIVDSDIDAAWFSRPPAGNPIAWEIRYLGDIPFAFLEILDEQAPDFESRLNEVEGRLNKSVSAKKSA